mgnify:CR=1 FL=1
MRLQRKIILELASKELKGFFSSPIAYLILGGFIALSLFVFFWVEAFFARNIADARPLFESLPILLIFLCSAVTMRMWSEERRIGTLEFLSTLPVTTPELVFGKAVACLTLIVIGLIMTLPIPITVNLLGTLDWGPVFAGYIASSLLAASYLAIGLFVSARSDSQIVSLLVSSGICGVFYLLGSNLFVDLYPSAMQDLLRSIGSGSRFESITRGLLDLRDMYFYISITAIFLTLNIYSLKRESWADVRNSERHTHQTAVTTLLIINLFLANLWLHPVTSFRADVTEGRIFSISDSTRSYLSQLDEPLRIRGYFSQKTHPLLAPLAPQLKDLLKEYEVASQGKVALEFIDPALDPELENEANVKYGIRAVPFQISDRYQASLVNSYFDLLLEYGDEFEVLGFSDLIEVKSGSQMNLEVRLENPEFDITRGIKRVLYGFQEGGSIFDSISDSVQFVGYISDDRQLPEMLSSFKAEMPAIVESLIQESDGKLSAQILDPQSGDGGLADKILADYGFQPMVASLFDENRFYFYMTLQSEETVVQVPLPDPLEPDALARALEDSLKRFAEGLLKTVVLVTPAQTPEYMRGRNAAATNEYNQLTSALEVDFTVIRDDLQQGKVPDETDLLIILEPKEFDERQVFAIDQFLMKGGTILLSSSPFSASMNTEGLFAIEQASGLEGWLKHQGISFEKTLLMDAQNSALPIPVTRNLGGFSFQDLVLLDYPYFADVRGEGLSDELSITRGIPQVTVSWPSPLTIGNTEGRSSTILLKSSPESWVTTDTGIMPQLSEDGQNVFSPDGEIRSRDIAVLMEGKFKSFFADKSSPMLNEAIEQNGENFSENDVEPMRISSIIEKSPESSRLLVVSSNAFLSDQTLGMLASADGSLHRNNVQLIANTVDWALEETNLNNISSRGQFNRTLPPLDQSQQTFIEAVNYAVSVILLLMIYWIAAAMEKKRRALYAASLANIN